MFEKRLRIFLSVLAFALLVLVVRLAELQLVHGAHYRARAEQAVISAPSQLPFVRGTIRDRRGEPLVRDEACWDVKVDFAILAADASGEDEYIRRRLKQWRRRGRYPGAVTDDDVASAFRNELAAMWSHLAQLSPPTAPMSTSDLRARAKRIYGKVLRVRDVVARRRGFDAPVSEETEAHTLLGAIDAERQIAARELLGVYPWVRIETSSVRRFSDRATPFAHVLGRLGRVDAGDLANDPEADNPFARYQADEWIGISGVERLAEASLRGRRGRLVKNRDGALVEEIEAQNGEDVRMTIDGVLQRRLYALLAETVREHPDSSGGAIVVLDVKSREVLALVSYPSYDPNQFGELYNTLRDDTDHLPLRFRAVSTRYPPGSTIKPLACLAALINKVITTDSREECTGYLHPDIRSSWRCWSIHGSDARKAHGTINVVEALTGSCNVFMYRIGERLGVDRLCVTFDMAGIGRTTGIGLREDNPGINPTAGWLMANKNQPVTPGTSRHFAIGQGEISMTPIQVANLMATYVSGRWRPVTLIASDDKTPEWSLPATQEHWDAIRRGIFGVTNDPTGTAFRYAHFQQDGYVLCGKTGSATAHPWPTAFSVPYVDANGAPAVALVREGAKGPAISRFKLEHPDATFDPKDITVARRWPLHPPTDGENHSHAWFGGYLQAVNAAGEPDFSKTPRVAFAVLVEFGGSGGRTGGPLAKRVSATLLDVLGPDLLADDRVAEALGR